MIDRLFFAALTFCVLAGGTVAVGSAMMDYDRQAAEVRAAVVQLPRVEVVGRRMPTPVARTDRGQSAQDLVQ